MHEWKSARIRRVFLRATDTYSVLEQYASDDNGYFDDWYYTDADEHHGDALHISSSGYSLRVV